MFDSIRHIKQLITFNKTSHSDPTMTIRIDAVEDLVREVESMQDVKKQVDENFEKAKQVMNAVDKVTKTIDSYREALEYYAAGHSDDGHKAKEVLQS